MNAYVNGEYLPADVATVSIEDRGLLSGDGIYESARLHQGRYFRLDRHLERLAGSAHTLRLEIPEAATLAQIAETLAAQSELHEGTLRILVTRGTRTAVEPTLVVTLNPVPAERMRAAARGMTLATAHTRRPATDVIPAALKTIGRTWAVLARLEAESERVDDVLLLSNDGFIAEGPTWNVFWRIGDALFTPALDVGVLAGVTRGAIIDMAPDAGFQVHETRSPRFVLDDADEMFATMSSVGVVPIRSLDGRLMPSDLAATTLFERYWDLVRKECSGGTP